MTGSVQGTGTPGDVQGAGTSGVVQDAGMTGVVGDAGMTGVVGSESTSVVPGRRGTTRVVVVGAGLSGLVAAIRLATGGARVTLVAKGLGGLQLGQGTIDVLGYAPDRITDPLGGMDALVAREPGHPYAVLGADRVRTSLTYLAGLVGPELLQGDPESNLHLPTAVGAIRPTCLAPASMVAGNVRDGQHLAIVGLRRLKDFPAGLVAGNLARTTLPDGGRLDARSLIVDVPARDGEVDSSGLTYARAFDDPGFRGRFADVLRPRLIDGERVGLPAVLGYRDLTAWRDLSERLGHEVFEIPLPPPSVPGMRLNDALTSLAKAAGVRIVLGSSATSAQVDGDRIVSVTVATTGAPRVFPADAVVLATGGFESGALAVDSHRHVSETLLGLPVRGADEPLIRPGYWGTDQPVFRTGVDVDADMRVLDAAGAPVYANLAAAGGIIAGAARWTEKSGDGIALASAVVAAETILNATVRERP